MWPWPLKQQQQLVDRITSLCAHLGPSLSAPLASTVSHSLALFDPAHFRSTCAANVVPHASSRRVPGPGGGIEMPWRAGGNSDPHVIRQLVDQQQAGQSDMQPGYHDTRKGGAV